MDCLDKLLIVRFTEQRMFWNKYNNTYVGLLSKVIQRRPRVCLREGAFFKDHTHRAR